MSLFWYWIKTGKSAECFHWLVDSVVSCCFAKHFLQIFFRDSAKYFYLICLTSRSFFVATMGPEHLLLTHVTSGPSYSHAKPRYLENSIFRFWTFLSIFFFIIEKTILKTYWIRSKNNYNGWNMCFFSFKMCTRSRRSPGFF